MLKSMNERHMLELTVPAKLAETALSDMLRLVQEALSDMAMPLAATTLPWPILSGRLDRKEVVWLLKHIVGLGR